MGDGRCSTEECRLCWILDWRILRDEAGVLWLGSEGQGAFGSKYFLEPLSVFSAPLITVPHGRHELGSVDETSFLGRRDDAPMVLLLAGRAWRVNHLDWKRLRAHVEPAEDAGRSRWRGGAQLLGHDRCRSIRMVLADEVARPGWSRRSIARMETIRAGLSLVGMRRGRRPARRRGRHGLVEVRWAGPTLDRPAGWQLA